MGVDVVRRCMGDQAELAKVQVLAPLRPVSTKFAGAPSGWSSRN